MSFLACVSAAEHSRHMTECVAQAVAHMTATGRAFSVRSSTQSFSQRNLSDTITLSASVSNKFIEEVWFKSVKHAAGEHTQCWLMNGFSFMGHKQHSLSHHVGRTSKEANSKCFCVTRIFQIHASPSYKTMNHQRCFPNLAGLDEANLDFYIFSHKHRWAQ